MTQERKMAGKIQLNKRQKDILFYLSLVMISVYVFLLAGEKGYILFDDSHTYIEDWFTEGVMPIYPLFIHLNLFLFGENIFLMAIVVEQAILATICVTIFSATIKKRFSLSYVESYIVFAFTFLPFTIELPTAMITHMILTEGIAYALFYIFVIIMLKAVWYRSWKWLAGGWFMALLLSLIRSQLLLLFGVWGVIVLYVAMLGKRKKAILFLVALACCMILGSVGVFSNIGVNSTYQKTVKKIEAKTGESEWEEDSQKKETDEQGENKKDKEDGQTSAVSVSQYASLFFSRGMYEADYADYLLFEEGEMRELFLRLYDAADQEKCRYEYAQGGLWAWRDIAGGIGKVGKVGFNEQKQFYLEVKPEIFGNTEQYQLLSNHNYTIIGITLLKHHFGRFMYHTLQMLPQAFICTVFFQIAPVYLLCHLITLFLYISAIALMIWAFADSKVDRAYAEFMAFILGTNLVMVILISMIFFGQQRYLFYTFGMFYIAYFLLVVQLWKKYGVRMWKAIRHRVGEKCRKEAVNG